VGIRPDAHPKSQSRQSVIFDFFHWFVGDARAWITAIAHTHPYWVFPIAFAIAFSESFVGVSFIVPGTILLLSLGGVIGATHIGLFPAVAGAVLGSVLGDWISWWIGFHYHHKIVHFALFRRFEEQIEKGLHFFHRWGTWAIFIGRFMGPFRATVPLVAGMSELEFWPFMIANATSAVIWAVALLAFPAYVAHYLLT
jgi:membrane protein DedA with SNARE-associated domain